MNWLYIAVDVFIVILLLIWARMGWQRGMVTEIATLIGLFLGIFAGFRLSPWLSARLGWTSQPPVDHAIWFAITFIAIYIAAQFIGEWLSDRLKRLRFGVIDRALGLVVSVVEGMSFMAACGYALSLSPKGASFVSSTYLLRFITDVTGPFFKAIFGG